MAASAGTIANLSVARHPEIGGVRVGFELQTADAETIELRLALKQGEQIISESLAIQMDRKHEHESVT